MPAKDFAWASTMEASKTEALLFRQSKMPPRDKAWREAHFHLVKQPGGLRLHILRWPAYQALTYHFPLHAYVGYCLSKNRRYTGNEAPVSNPPDVMFWLRNGLPEFLL